MKPLIHKELSDGRWWTFTIFEQLGNIGSEFERAARAFERRDDVRFENAFERMLELFDLTVEDPKWQTACRLRELLRLREEVCDVFHGNAIIGTRIETLKKYFLYFGIAARAHR